MFFGTLMNVRWWLQSCPYFHFSFVNFNILHIYNEVYFHHVNVFIDFKFYFNSSLFLKLVFCMAGFTSFPIQPVITCGTINRHGLNC